MITYLADIICLNTIIIIENIDNILQHYKIKQLQYNRSTDTLLNLVNKLWSVGNSIKKDNLQIQEI